MVFSGDDGLDELTTTTTSTVHELLADGETNTFTVDPRDFDMAPSTVDDLAGGDATANAARVTEVLGGTESPVRDIAVLNAAAALMVAELASGFADGIAKARTSIDDGAASKALDALVRVSQAEHAAGGD
jgi:anthranilate phosphoribosyltransferase